MVLFILEIYFCFIFIDIFALMTFWRKYSRWPFLYMYLLSLEPGSPVFCLHKHETWWSVMSGNPEFLRDPPPQRARADSAWCAQDDREGHWILRGTFVVTWNMTAEQRLLKSEITGQNDRTAANHRIFNDWNVDIPWQVKPLHVSKDKCSSLCKREWAGCSGDGAGTEDGRRCFGTRDWSPVLT